MFPNVSFIVKIIESAIQLQSRGEYIKVLFFKNNAIGLRPMAGGAYYRSYMHLDNC